MKLTIIITLICLMVMAPVAAFAKWVTANQVTVSWDANDTSSIEEGERLVYRVYLSNVVTDPDKTNPAIIGDTAETSMVLTLAEKGRYMAGVEAVLQVLGEDGTTWEDVAHSEISWSDDPTVTKDGIVFGVRFYPAPKKPVGIFVPQT